MAATFTGQIVEISPLETLKNANGTLLTKREVILQTKEKNPQSILVFLYNETAVSFVGQVGQTATAHLKFKTFTASNGRKYNNITAWRIDVETTHHP